MSDPSTHEAEVRTLLQGWVAAVGAADLDGVLAHHDDGIVMFDVPPPHDGLRGGEAYRGAWPPFLRWQGAGATFELVELEVVAGEEVAWAWALLRCGTSEELAEVPERRLRLTVGLVRSGGRWVVRHEHHSFALTG